MFNQQWLGQFLHQGNQGQNQQTPGMNYLQQVPGIFNPYYQNGMNQGNMLSGQYGNMATNPSGVINGIMNNYQPSQNYQLMQKYLAQNEANTAAAGGQRGSQYDVAQTAGLTNRLLQGDMQQWLQNNLGVMGQGLQGAHGMYDTGLQAGADMGNAYGNMGQLDFEQWRQQMEDQTAQKEMHNENQNSWLGAIGGLGGEILGGPIGGYIGKSLFG